MTLRLPSSGLSLAWLAFLTLAPAAAGAQTTVTVRVDCNRRDTITEALERRRNARELIVEITGVCRENVVVTRDRVTLRGTDPSSDGIAAVANAEPIDAALWVRGAHLVTIENLKLTGGFAGLLASEVSTPHLRLLNVRAEGNTNFGLQLEGGLIHAEDSTFSGNNVNVAVFKQSRFECLRCTFSAPTGGFGPNLRTNVLSRSDLVLIASTLTDGGLNLTGGLSQIADTAITAFAPGAALVDSGGTSSLTRVQLHGHVGLSGGAQAQFLGVTQSATQANIVDNSSFLRLGDAPPLAGGPPSIPSSISGVTVRGFSNALIQQTSRVHGDLSCTQGANAFCSNASNVSGTSNCALCLKP